MNKSDIIIALLDFSGADIDSGVAAEIGYANAIDKRIYGLRSDFRQGGENLGVDINLQVEYFIRASGGDIFYNLDQLISHLKASS